MKTFNFKTFSVRISVLFSIIISACSNFSEVDLPSSQLTSGAVFEDKTTAEAAVVNIYSKIRDTGLLTGYPMGLSNQLGLYADELKYYGLSGTGQSNFFNNTPLASDNEISQLWNSSYSQIYAANAIIEEISESSSLAISEKNQFTGEALFARALIHFYLTNCYGAIPYITTTNYKTNSSVSRMTESDVYIRVKKDLEQAAELLTVEYRGAERVRPNKFAAKALLARVCLYMGLWQEASNYASAVLNQTDFYKWPTSLDIFLKDSSSTIWQLMPSTAGSNTYEGNNFIFFQGPPPSVAISEELVNAFTSEDLRKTHWLKAVTDGTTVWYYAYKYKKQSITSSSAEYSIVLRMAEQYIIRAESRAHTGDLIGAKEDLNKTRNLAGLPNTTAVTSEQIIEAVQTERRLELFAEYGHRFFDLKRTGSLDNTLSAVKSQWKPSNRFLPLPQSELLLNPNLGPQNEGY